MQDQWSAYRPAFCDYIQPSLGRLPPGQLSGPLPGLPVPPGIPASQLPLTAAALPAWSPAGAAGVETWAAIPCPAAVAPITAPAAARLLPTAAAAVAAYAAAIALPAGAAVQGVCNSSVPPAPLAWRQMSGAASPLSAAAATPAAAKAEARCGHVTVQPAGGEEADTARAGVSPSSYEDTRPRAAAAAGGRSGDPSFAPGTAGRWDIAAGGGGGGGGGGCDDLAELWSAPAAATAAAAAVGWVALEDFPVWDVVGDAAEVDRIMGGGGGGEEGSESDPDGLHPPQAPRGGLGDSASPVDRRAHGEEGSESEWESDGPGGPGPERGAWCRPAAGWRGMLALHPEAAC